VQRCADLHAFFGIDFFTSGAYVSIISSLRPVLVGRDVEIVMAKQIGNDVQRTTIVQQMTRTCVAQKVRVLGVKTATFVMCSSIR